MTKLKSISAKRAIKILEKIGFQPVRQKGSHLFLKNPDGRVTTIPIHNKDINIQTIQDILDEIRISRDEWIELIESLIIF